MVKYEDRQRRRVKLGHDPVDTNLESSAPSNHTANNSTSNIQDVRPVSSRSIGVGADHVAARHDKSEPLGPSRQRSRDHVVEILSRKEPPKLAWDSEEQIPHDGVDGGGSRFLHRHNHPNVQLNSRSELNIRSKKQTQGIRGDQQMIGEDGVSKERNIYSTSQKKPVDEKRRPATAAGTHGHGLLVDRPSQGGGLATQSATMPRIGKENEASHDETSELLYLLGGMLGEHDNEIESVSSGKLFPHPHTS